MHYKGAIGGGEQFGDGVRNSVLTGVKCNGTEDNLFHCVFNASGVSVASDCGALKDAHVVCQG